MKTESSDVVVVGLGNAAEAAAVSAHQAGAKVLVLEKAPQAKKGGNTWFSHGAQFRHAHNGIQDEKPLLPHISESEWEKIDLPPYTKDEFYGDLMRVTRGRAVPELAELLVNESYPTVKWMQEMGIQWEILYTAAKPEGGRFRWHQGSSFIHAKDGGGGLVEMWYRIIQEKGIPVRFETGAVRLLTNEKGAVYGIVAQSPEGLSEIHCKGVVLACGGFEANPALRAQFLGAGWDLAKVRGTRYNTGDGIQMALDIGAQPFGHWSGTHSTPIDADAGDYEGGFLDPANRRYRTHRYAWTLGIMVNTEGRRFVDEGEDFHAFTYAKNGAEILKQPGGIAYQIFDDKVKEPLSRQLYDGATPVIANTIRELAEKLEINPDALEKTVDEFNRAVVGGRPFNEVIRDGNATKGIYPPKSNWAQKIDTPPFVAYAATCGVTFTYGGLKINTRCQVLNLQDRPIPGLYAAGELTAGFFYYNYPSGSGLMRGAVTGKIAGANAAGA
ncbi:MAG TPA: FAD-dependent tricarballylate dehydrogenase TcuA [Candidatus Acidoferrales bacterium]|nr:FAD-dependent tricarballylate dehydrogenase TcuA [Candidatus Acidoferrales bacterium]